MGARGAARRGAARGAGVQAAGLGLGPGVWRVRGTPALSPGGAPALVSSEFCLPTAARQPSPAKS